MGDSTLPRRPEKHFTALKETFQKVPEAFKKKSKPGSPIPTTPIDNATADDEQKPLPPLHTPIQAKMGEIEVSTENNGEDAIVGDMSRTAATSGTNDAATTHDNAQPEDNPSHTNPSQNHKDSSHAPIWSQTLDEWKKEHSEAYQASVKAAGEALQDRGRAIGALYNILGKEQATGKYRARVRHYQTSLSSLRGIAMAVSNMDPYKLAPIICASVFFTIDVSIALFP
jgi:hypothetical protein